MSLRLSEIAARLGAEIIGDASLEIQGLAPIETAKQGQIAFVANAKYLQKAAESHASAIIVKAALPGVEKNFLVIDDPYYAFARLLTLFHPPRTYAPGIDAKASVGKDVSFGEGVYVGPMAVIEDGVTIGDGVQIRAGVFVGEGSEIGDETLLYPNVTIREDVKIGKRVIIHSGTVIGSDGFGFAPHKGRHYKIPQVGGVIIEDDVEFGANCAVDRAVLGQTIVRCGTKIDNLVQIGHNVSIGNDTILVAQVGISGSVDIGHHVTLAGQVGVSGHLKIGDNVMVGGKSGVTKDIASRQIVSGFPPVPHKTWLKREAAVRHLPELKKQVKALSEKLALLDGILFYWLIVCLKLIPEKKLSL